MSYEYEIYSPGSRRDVLATFSTDEPLPHIQVGHSLFLEHRNYSTKFDVRLEIVGVEVLLYFDSKYERLKPPKTMVFLEERART